MLIHTVKERQLSFIHFVQEYRRQLLKEEADFWFNGKAVDMVASICESQKLEDDEVKRIKKILNGLNK